MMIAILAFGCGMFFNDLEKEIARVKEAHRRHEFAEVNTCQLVILENRLNWVSESIARRLGNGSRYK